MLHVHGGLVEMQKTIGEIMVIEPGDLYCARLTQPDYRPVYGIIPPFSLSIRQLQFGGGYNAEKWMQILMSRSTPGIQPRLHWHADEGITI